MNITEAAAKIEEWSGKPTAPDTLYNYFQRRQPHLTRRIIISHGRRVVDIDEQDLRDWHERMQDREPKTSRVKALTTEEREALKAQRKERSAARVKQENGADFIYNRSKQKVFLPQEQPTDFEFRMLVIFAEVTHSKGVFVRDGITYPRFYPSSVLVRAVERSALARLADKGWLSRLEPELAVYRINEAGRWYLKTFELDEE